MAAPAPSPAASTQVITAGSMRVGEGVCMHGHIELAPRPLGSCVWGSHLGSTKPWLDRPTGHGHALAEELALSCPPFPAAQPSLSRSAALPFPQLGCAPGSSCPSGPDMALTR
eukprot:358007-Chlamydomonas_euryale.AAC.4